jgi:hypothetical protein
MPSVSYGVMLAACSLCSCRVIEAQDKPKFTREVRSILDSAPLAAPELAADILIRFAASPAVSDPAAKKQMLEDAVRMAGAAKYPLKLVGAVPNAGLTDSDAGVLWAALDLNLAALSLRARVVDQMLRLDPARALGIFREILPLNLPPLTCANSMAYSLSDFYNTAEAVLAGGFTQKQRREGKHLELAQELIGAIASPFQLEPAMKMLVQLKVSKASFESLLAAYGVALKNMNADDRSFSAAMDFSFLQSLIEITKLLGSREVGAGPLIDAFRSYYVRHASASRCADSVNSKVQVDKSAQITEQFNRYLQPLAPDVAAIKPEEVKAARAEGNAQVYVFWQTDKSKQLLSEIKHLRFGTPEQIEANNRRPRRSDGRAQFLTDEQRRDPSWESEAIECLEDLESWNRDHNETETNYFNQLCFAYNPLLELIPLGKLHDRVLQSYAHFLARSPMKTEDPPVWFLHVNRFLHLRDADKATLDGVEQEARRSGDPIFGLYLDLERVTRK